MGMVKEIVRVERFCTVRDSQGSEIRRVLGCFRDMKSHPTDYSPKTLGPNVEPFK